MRPDSVVRALANRVLDALPQTQCTRCGYPDCRAYADAIASQADAIDRCPPGGAEGVRRLAAITGRPPVPLDRAHGVESPRRLAVIDEDACIGCTLCLKACPVDCIIGGPKAMHTVIDAHCTGCELCIPACPVDCISLVEVSQGRTGWDAWSPSQADAARRRYGERQRRLERVTAAKAPALPVVGAPDRKRSIVDAALQRARAGRLAG